MHGGQRRGLVGGHQGTLGHRGLANAAADRRADAGIGENDVGAVEVGARGTGIGLGQFQCGNRILVFLHADRIDQRQFADALGGQARGGQGGLGAGELGAGAVCGGAITGVIDLVQRLSLLDLAAFGEQALGDDAGDLRAHFGNPERRGAARQFADQGHRPGFEGDHGDLGRRSRWGRHFAAAGSHGEAGSKKGKESWKQ